MLIGSFIPVTVVLTTLYLNGNSIGNEGAKAIAEALKVNATLTKLELWANRIGHDGAKAIAEALKFNAPRRVALRGAGLPGPGRQ